MEAINVTSDDRAHVVEIAGTLDRTLASRMREETTLLCSNGEARAIILDMTNVTHMDSMGVGMLISAYKSCKARNLPFGLAALNDRTADILRITRLDGVLPIYADLSSARKALNLD
jgi:anti-sigma B factor antagonist